MTTLLGKPVRRLVTVDGSTYTVVIDLEGVRLLGKGKRKAEAQLAWKDLVSGDAAIAAALNASLDAHPQGPTAPKSGPSPKGRKA